MLRRTRRFPNPFQDYSGSMPSGTSTETVLNSVREIVGRILANTSDRVNECDGGLYVGTPGVAYALYRAARSGLFPISEAMAFLERARILADVAVHWADSERDPKSRAGFLLGGAGAYLVAALLNNLSGKMDEVRKYVDRYASLAHVCEPMLFLSCGSDEFFVGRAGYLMGALILQRDTGIEVLPPNQAALLCRTMVESGRQYSARVQSLSPLMFSYYDVEYLGAAHGLAAILQVLLLHEKLLSEAECSLVWASVDFLLMLERDGNWPPVMCEQIGSDDDQLVHWCHGAPGVALLFVKAYQLSGRLQYLAACERAAQCIWNKGLLRKGPGTCHGVAGNGYLFLVLYRLTQDPKYFYRAYRFMEFMFTEEFCRGARTPDSPYSLFEGLAGTACFLLDLIKPDGAEFPLYTTL